MSDNDHIIGEFLSESGEALDRMNASLLELENGGDGVTHIGNVFRGFHTIKGTCGFLGFGQLEKLGHAAENLLDKMRSGKLAADTSVINTLLRVCDAIRQCLSIIQANGNDRTFAPDSLVVELEKIIRREESVSTPAQTASMPGTDSSQTAVIDNTIRLDIRLLDKLMNLVGELVLARNKILRVSNDLRDTNLVSSSQHISIITTELQETVMKTRLQPISNVWQYFPRVARDMAMMYGKSVGVVMHGEDTELDKTIIEAIKDPLTHLLRNAVDHGLETKEERVASGKSEKGTITLNAFHEGGQVNIEISDDGRGIDLEKIAQKLVQSGRQTRETVDNMSERDLIMMIFTPGFSTAAEVTRISGRGVGMDVVKTNIEKIGGSVDAFTKKGRGTTFKIKIPLTLAIIPALIVHCDSQRYAIPQVNLMELVRIDQNAGEQQIEYIHNAPVFRLRGNLLPLVSLGQILGVSNNVTTRKKGVSSIVVLKYLDKTFGLIVDEISDTQEIVVKPLSKQLKDIREFSGATITGDGQVALILDVMGVAQNVKISEETAEGALVFNQQVKTGTLTTQADSLLFFRVAGKAVMAMPLSEVARLEEIKTSSIQTAADREVVEYRGMILPLIRLSRLYRDGAGDAGGAETLPVIVHRHEDQLVGFVVDQILDVSDEEISTRNDSPTAGIRCSALIGERITDILDTARVVELYLSDFAGQAASGGLS